MLKKILCFILSLSLALFIPLASEVVFSQEQGKIVKPAQVILEEQIVLEIPLGVASLSAEDRASLTSEKILKAANNNNLNAEDIQINTDPQKNYTTISTPEFILLTITDEDAKFEKMTRQDLAEKHLKSIRRSLTIYRRERELTYRIFAAMGAIFATLSIVLIFRLINYLFPLLKNQIHRTVDNFVSEKQVSNHLLVASEISHFIIQILRLLRIVAFIGIIYLYIPLVLRFFPLTRRLGNTLYRYLESALSLVGNAIYAYLPNVFIVLLIYFITYWLLDFIEPIFDAIQANRLSFPGFYPEWARPTYHLVKFIIIAIALAIALPYIPGFKSPAFQGVSVFLGLLFSLGSTSAIANTVGGIILIYTRAFQIGDRIRVGEVVGNVEEKSLLVTRLRTPKNILITIPNSTLLGVNIINYSASYRDTQIPLILNTTITLGYDIPWRKVHQTLIEAALATPEILPEPRPFVLQTALNDFYISYELNAYTQATKRLEPIYSELHQNILDKCSQAGIEILSPHYRALRDGNQSTIPDKVEK
jgi:small-conductance mechanosensitive channel